MNTVSVPMDFIKSGVAEVSVLFTLSVPLKLSTNEPVEVDDHLHFLLLKLQIYNNFGILFSSVILIPTFSPLLPYCVLNSNP